MPNLRSQSINPDGGVTLVASDGRAITLLQTAIIAFYNTTTGGEAARLGATAAWARQQIEAALGPEQVPQGQVTVAWSVATGVTQLETR